jgi:CRP-like cAMP-binding protein
MEEFLVFLNDLFPLSNQLQHYLPSIMTLRHYQKNEFIVKDAPVSNRFYFVVQGLVRYYYLYRGQEISKWFFTDNDVIAFNEYCQKKQPTDEHLIAYRPTTILSVPIATLNDSYAKFPELEHYGRIIAEKYGALWFCILDGIRLKTAHERTTFLKEEFPDLVNAIPIRHLAACIDLNPYTLIKARSKRSRYQK